MVVLQQRRATAADFAAANPILDDGEFGEEIDTKIYKVGNGTTPWNSLDTPYIPSKLITARGDLIVGGSSGAATKLPRGNNGQTLTVGSDGTLQWVDAPNFSDFASSAYMSSTFQTKTAAASAHALLIQANDAYNTYISAADAAIAHAIHIKSVDAATNYTTPTLMGAATEHKDFIAVKTADQIVTNSTVKVADTVLTFPCVANTQYIFEMYLTIKGTTSGGMSLGVSFPSGASIIWGVHAPVKAGGASLGNVRFAASGTSVDVGVNGGTPLFLTLKGTLFTVATAGSCGLTFAQTVAAASTSATLMANSYIKAIKV